MLSMRLGMRPAVGPHPKIKRSRGRVKGKSEIPGADRQSGRYAFPLRAASTRSFVYGSSLMRTPMAS